MLLKHRYELSALDLSATCLPLALVEHHERVDNGEIRETEEP